MRYCVELIKRGWLRILIYDGGGGGGGKYDDYDERIGWRGGEGDV